MDLHRQPPGNSGYVIAVPDLLLIPGAVAISGRRPRAIRHDQQAILQDVIANRHAAGRLTFAGSADKERRLATVEGRNEPLRCDCPRGSHNASTSSLLSSAASGICHARDGCHGAKLGRTRRGGGCDHRRCGRRPTRRGSGSRHGCRCRSPSPPALAWPLLLASWSLLGAHRREIAPGVFPLLPVAALNG